MDRHVRAAQGRRGRPAGRRALLAYKGILYIPDGLSAVRRSTARPGKTLWYYSPKNDNPALLPAVRGLAIGDGKIFEGQNDGNLVALDQTTGNPIWKTKVGDPTDGIQFSSAPIYFNGMVIEGASGGDWGGRSFAVALDAKTGDEFWRWYIAPSPGSLGSGTWGINEWQRGGGAIWIYPTSTSSSGLLYLVTGNPIPWNGRGPGNNLWTDSIVALHIDIGQVRLGLPDRPPRHLGLRRHEPADALRPGVQRRQHSRRSRVASKTGWVYILEPQHRQADPRRSPRRRCRS